MLAAFTLSVAVALAVAPVAFGETTSGTTTTAQPTATAPDAAILAAIDSRIQSIQSIANTAGSPTCASRAVPHFEAIRDITLRDLTPEIREQIGDRALAYKALTAAADRGAFIAGRSVADLKDALAQVKAARAALN